MNSAAGVPESAAADQASTEVFGYWVRGNEQYRTLLPSSNVDYNQLPTYPARPHFHNSHVSMALETQVVAFNGAMDDPTRPSSMPIYQTATFCQPDADHFGSYDYTRSGNPTRTACETLLAGLEGAYAAFCFSSGMSALSAVILACCEAGDAVICGSDIYGGMHRYLSRIASKMNIQVLFVDTADTQKLQQAVSGFEAAGTTRRLRLVHCESPSNPRMRITDLRAAAQITHHAGALFSVDNTIMSPVLQKPLALGADIVVHSATKFLSGHADFIAGVVACRTEELARKVAFVSNAEGTALDPMSCWLLMRSVKTLHLRVERCAQNAELVAAFLSQHPRVTRLHFAGPVPNPKTAREDKAVNISSSHLAHRLHMTQAMGGGSVISFETGDAEYSKLIINALKLFKITVSFGSCSSTAELPCLLSHASIPAQERTIPADLIRVSIGIEHIKDILEDLRQAFARASAVCPSSLP